MAAPTLAQFAPEFLAAYAEVENKPSEVNSKRSILDHHLIPRLGALPLDQIGRREIDGFRAAQLKAGLNPKTINNQLSVLRTALTLALEWELIEKVPRFRWLKTREPEFDFLSFEEARALTDGADPEWRAMLVVALKCGLRIGELRALRWRDVEFGGPNPRLHVRQAVAREVLGTPKSAAGQRTIPLCRKAVQALRSHVRRLHSELVFCQPTGEMLTEAMTRKPLRRALKASGLRHIGWHVLRHTFASHLVMRGAKIEAVKELMGHSTIDQTMRYVHLSPQFRQDTVSLLDSVIPERKAQR